MSYRASASRPPSSPAVEGSNRGISRRILARLGDRRESIALGAQLAPITIFLSLFFIGPLVVFFIYSFWRVASFRIVREFNLQAYRDVLLDPISHDLFLTTIRSAFEVSLLTTFAAYLFAHVVRFHLQRWQEALLFTILIALFSGYLVRIYAWRIILGDNGAINSLLTGIGMIDEPFSFLIYSRFAVVLVLTNFLIPLAVLPIYAALQDVDDSVIEAARDLGCRADQALFKITLPLAWHGIFVAWALSFIIAAGDYLTPQLVGGASGTMVGRIIASEFGQSFNWPQGAARSFVTLAIVLVFIGLVRNIGTRVLK